MEIINSKNMKRKTSKDYRKEYNDLTNGMKSLEAHLTERLLQLAASYPDAVIEKRFDIEIKAGSSLGNRSYVVCMSIEKKIKYIEIIENWLSDQNPVKQKTINYDVPN